MPYLKKPRQKSIRDYNFTQVGPNIQAGNTINGPCTINTGCTQIPVTEGVCTDNGGTWWGEPNGSDPSGVGEGPPQTSCCGVNQYLTANDQQPYGVLPDEQLAMRDSNFKLVKYTQTDWDSTSSMCSTESFTEFYRVAEGKPPKLDNSESNLLASNHRLTPAEEVALQSLSMALKEVLASNTPCSGAAP